MLALLRTTDSLTAVLSGAAATTNPTYAAVVEAGGQALQPTGSLSGATAVSIVPAPSHGELQVKSLNIYNGDTAAVVLTIAKVISGTSYTLWAGTLQVGDTLRFDDHGPHVTDSSGQIKQSVGTGSLIVGAAAGTGVTVVEADLGGGWNRTTLTLADTPIVLVDEAATVAYGGLKVYDMPRGRIFVLSAATVLAVHKTSAGVNDDFDGDFSMGTVTATNNATLLTTEANIIASAATPQAVDGDTTANGGSSGPLAIDGLSTPMDVYLNAVVDDADHDVTGTPCNLEFTGTIEIIWKYLGV